MHDPLIAIDHHVVTIERLGADAVGMNNERDRKRARHDCGMAADRPFFEDDPAQRPAIFEQFTGADIARDKDRVGRHFCPGLRALPSQNPQKPV